MSNSRSRGPPLPHAISGSSLQAQLESEGAQILRNNNHPLIDHIIRHATPGYITKAIWLQEHSVIEHEYLLLCVKTYDGRLSWMRVERMGDLPEGSDATNALTDQAQLVVTIAPSRENLVCGDRILVEADLDTNKARLSDIAKLILIVHNEEPQYHLQWHNCWWLARVIMQVLSGTYMHNNPKQKKKVTKRCDSSHQKHVNVVSAGGPFAGLGQLATHIHFNKRTKRIVAKFNGHLNS
ncbi:Ff.00g085340.m01.CDS01 [Fusarium sp. VM40]|nr:Ff.00g085340.m01.CDS01 [Fusarium sp. VM40]